MTSRMLIVLAASILLNGCFEDTEKTSTTKNTGTQDSTNEENTNTGTQESTSEENTNTETQESTNGENTNTGSTESTTSAELYDPASFTTWVQEQACTSTASTTCTSVASEADKYTPQWAVDALTVEDLVTNGQIDQVQTQMKPLKLGYMAEKDMTVSAGDLDVTVKGRMGMIFFLDPANCHMYGEADSGTFSLILKKSSTRRLWPSSSFPSSFPEIPSTPSVPSSLNEAAELAKEKAAEAKEAAEKAAQELKEAAENVKVALDALNVELTIRPFGVYYKVTSNEMSMKLQPFRDPLKRFNVTLELTLKKDSGCCYRRWGVSASIKVAIAALPSQYQHLLPNLKLDLFSIDTGIEQLDFDDNCATPDGF